MLSLFHISWKNFCCWLWPMIYKLWNVQWYTCEYWALHQSLSFLFNLLPIQKKLFWIEMFCMQLQNTMDMEHNMLHSAEHSTAIKGRQCCNPGMSSASNNGYFPQLPIVHIVCCNGYILWHAWRASPWSRLYSGQCLFDRDSTLKKCKSVLQIVQFSLRIGSLQDKFSLQRVDWVWWKAGKRG